jgi:hypothetical protein
MWRSAARHPVSPWPLRPCAPQKLRSAEKRPDLPAPDSYIVGCELPGADDSLSVNPAPTINRPVWYSSTMSSSLRCPYGYRYRRTTCRSKRVGHLLTSAERSGHSPAALEGCGIRDLLCRIEFLPGPQVSPALIESTPSDEYSSRVDSTKWSGSPASSSRLATVCRRSPFFIQDAKGRWLLARVTSRGTDLALTMCGDGGRYVRVDAYAEWIASTLTLEHA